MSPTRYTVDITLSRAIPSDILIEHLAVGLRSLGDTKVYSIEKVNSQRAYSVPVTAAYDPGRAFSEPEGRRATVGERLSVKPNRKVGRKHPFDGPEMFDDDEPSDNLPLDARFWNALRADFPHLSALFRAKDEERTVVSPPRDEPHAEGDWTLDSGDHVGEDT